MKISIIIPVLNEAGLLVRQLGLLQPARQQGHEVILVDGRSGDDSLTLAEPLVDKSIVTSKGRAGQMNSGALEASGEILLFLHIDTCLPADFYDEIEQAIADPRVIWGRFDLSFSNDDATFSFIASCINLRSHLTGVATGDQAIFVRRQSFEQLGGYAPIPLMEDIELSKRLRRLTWPVRIRARAVTSSRRWEENGIVRTILTMWWLRLLYFFGAKPEKLARIYYK